MNFSGDWRSPWSISGVMAAPSLITSSASSSSDAATKLGPLLFSPSTPPTNLLSSLSLHVPITLPVFSTAVRDNLGAFLTGGIGDAFFPQSLQSDLISSIVSDSDDNDDDPFLPNHFSVLKCRDADSYVFFFPTGRNSDKVGFFGITMINGQPKLVGNVDGDVFEQREGYRCEFQKIEKISVRGLDPYDPEPEGSDVEGYLLACTMFSVIWFRVESRFIDMKRSEKKPALIPLLKQGFKSCVVCACWNPNFVDESVLLLESGELIWINIDKKKGKTIPLLHSAATGGCKWLTCDFGVHPWAVLVAECESILMLDLRDADSKAPTVVAKVEDSSAPFLAFSIAEFDRFYFSVATNHHLFLFDTREPLYPLLVWDHGIRNPSCISMFRLSELRVGSEEFGQATNSGYAIMVGSIWNSKFKLFFYGPDLGVAEQCGSFYGGPRAFYAWEVPSSISLSGFGHGSADSVLSDLETSNAFLPYEAQHHLKKELVIGFYILPQRNPSDSSDFNLVRLISSGKLEFQAYRASALHCSSSSTGQIPPSSAKEFRVYEDELLNQDEVTDGRLRLMRFRFLNAYMHGCLPDALRKAMVNPQRLQGPMFQVKGVECNSDLWELIKSTIPTLSAFDDGENPLTISDVIADVSFPTSLYEIAARRILTSLSPAVCYLAFSVYPELFNEHSYSLEFLEVVGLLGNRHLPPVMMGKPSSRGERWSEKTPRRNFLVGPVLPVPVLLTLDKLYRDNNVDGIEDEEDGDGDGEWSISKQCSMIGEGLTTLMGDNDCVNLDCDMEYLESERKKNSCFFLYEPKVGKEQLEQLEHGMPSSRSSWESEIHSTFVCGKHVPSDSDAAAADGCSDLDMFDDLMPIRLEWNCMDVSFSQYERRVYKRWKRQFSKWQENYKPYQGFLSELV